jgi:uncharacterized protein YbjQ (UPF0145 family)
VGVALALRSLLAIPAPPAPECWDAECDVTDPIPPSSLPPTAAARLSPSTRRGSASLFTSDLTVNEFALVKECGFSPIALVMGTSMYHLGLEVQRWTASQELGALTRAMTEARQLAMTRMEAEADALGADGIVGVRLDMFSHAGAGDVMEFVAIGTAVKSTAGGSWQTAKGRPFTSDLSGQDFWTVVRTGHMPISLVLGVCVHHLAHQVERQAMAGVGPNAELPAYTRVLYDARELAMTRMQGEAELLRADGVVGVRVVTSSHIWGENAVEFLAAGTAVRAFPLDATLPSPTLVLSVAP